MEKMKILFIITRGDTIGGAQIHVFTLVSHLKKCGYDVLVVYGGSESVFFDLLNTNSIPSISIPYFKNSVSPFFDVRTVLKVDKIINTFSPDLICLHSTKAGILFRLSGYFRRIPVVLTVHGWAFTNGVSYKRQLIFSLIEKYFSKFITKYILVSNFDLQLAKQKNIAKLSKFELIHNGINKIPSMNSKSFSIGYGLTIVMISRFDEQKDQKLLLEACADLEEITIDFVGDGPKFNHVKNYFNNGKFRCKANFHGLQTNIASFLERADLFALVSNWEGFPLSTLEAMSFYLPVIVSNVGGASEAVSEGVNGFVVPKGDKKALKEKIEFLLKNKSSLKTLGNASFSIFHSYFSAETMIEKTINLYEKTLRNKN
jgi:glycosyltransferase involved in cell wall biosynthesis